MRRTKNETEHEREDTRGIKVEESILIRRPAAELYRFWRNLENLPSIMSHLKSVHEIDNDTSHWVARGPLNTSIEWDAQIITEEPDSLIGWQSLKDSEVPNAGSVRFEPQEGGLTEVKVALAYDPPGKRLGEAIAKLFGEDPRTQVAEDLGRFKQAMESKMR